MATLPIPPTPPCVGTHEPGNTSCDGDPKGSTVAEVSPCAWRDRCVGLQLYCAETGTTPDAVVQRYDRNGLIQLANKAVAKHGVKDGRPEGAPEPEPTAEPDAASPRRVRVAVRRRTKAKAPPLPQECVELYEHLLTQVRTQFPGLRWSEGKKVVVTPGTIYTRDHIDASRYITLYVKAARGWDRPLVSVHFKPLLRLLDVEIPLPLETLQRAVKPSILRKLDPRPLKHGGQFKCTCRHLDKGGVGYLIEALRKLDESGKITITDKAA